MKMLMVVYNEAIESDVMDSLKEGGMVNYTRMEHVSGKGTRSGVHDGTDIWPGLNNVLFIAVSDEKVSSLLEKVRMLRSRLGKEGVKAFVIPIDAAT